MAEEWGGIAYALQSIASAIDPRWTVVPILKVGHDLSEQALRLLRAIPGVDIDPGVLIVPEPNNRVELVYSDRARRTEKLTGGVAPWTWSELRPLVTPCDALYVNFISGMEMELDTALALRSGYSGPIYADLHSLFLGIGRHGVRFPRELPGWGAWLRCFDAVQMNEDEFELLGKAWGDPWRLAADVVSPQLKLIAVTLGERGAAYVAGAAFEDDPLAWPVTRENIGTPGPSRSRRVPQEGHSTGDDPTGCGDVWGGATYARLLSGDTLETAMAHANLLAARNASYRGADGLHRHLTGRLHGQQSP